jgi:large subunit ribosomal protein L15
MYLENIAKRTNRKKKGKRLGRGYGSGVGGHTVGRGVKGQKSRSGHKSLVSFEGGNVPFYRRIPKYPGFKSRSRIETQVINLNTLEENFKSGDKVNRETLESKGLVKKGSNLIKILAEGDIKKKFVIEGVKISSTAQEKVEKAGGTVK